MSGPPIGAKPYERRNRILKWHPYDAVGCGGDVLIIQGSSVFEQD